MTLRILSLVALLASACGPADPPAWIRLAEHHAADQLDAPAEEIEHAFTIAAEDWTWSPDVRLWRAQCPSELEVLRKMVGDHVTLRMGGRDVPRRSSGGPDTDEAHFWFASDSVLLGLPPGDEPEPSELLVTVTGGRRVESPLDGRRATWRVRAGRLTTDGFRVWEDRPVELAVESPSAAMLRFATTSAVPAPEDGGEISAGLRVLVGEEVLCERWPNRRTHCEYARHAVELPRGLTVDSPLRFECFGESAVVTIHVPVIGPADAGAPKRPDIVLFSADTFRADNLTYYGGDWGVTPNLDRLAEQSIRYERAWSTSVWTLPSHLSMLLGLHPYEHGATTRSVRPADGLVSVAQWLSEAGYRTAAVTDGGFVTESYRMDRGFEWFEARGSVSLVKTVRAALELLDADDGRPTFLFVHSYRMHAPYRVSRRTVELHGDRLGLAEAAALRRAVIAEIYDTVLEEIALGTGGDESTTALIGREDWEAVYARVLPRLVERGVLEPESGASAIQESLRRLYVGGLADFDMQIGAFLEALSDHGRYDDTYFLFTSDHGEAFGEHDMLFHKHGTWNEALAIPMLLRGPGLEPGPRTSDASLVDLPTTIASLADVPPYPGWRGRSLVASDEERGHDMALAVDCARYGDDTSMIVEANWKLSLSLDGDTAPLPSATHLYDLETDPHELDNLIEREADRAEAIIERWGDDLAERLRQRGPTVRVTLSDAERRKVEALGYVGDAN